jgi:hypothetical protein
MDHHAGGGEYSDPIGVFGFNSLDGIALTERPNDTTDRHHYHEFNVNRAARLQELEEMAAKLIATARELPPGQDHHNALREIERFIEQIAALKRRRFTGPHWGALTAKK